MAEVSSSSKMSLWPTLKKKIGDAKKKTTRKKPKVNPFASQGLEKFALLMAELQAKKTSLVDKTGNSVSAVRYLSRSAQEWTANTLARTASRCREKESPRASEVLLLQQSPPPPDSHSKERFDSEAIDFSQSFSFPDPGHGVLVTDETVDGSHGFGSEVMVVGDLQRDPTSASPLEGDADKLDERINYSEDRDPEQEDASSSGKTAGSATLPAKSARLLRNGRLLLLEKGWSRSPNSAVALLVALGACLGCRVTNFGNFVLEVLTIGLVVRWKKGMVYANFLQSLVARHVVPHLSIRVSRGLALLPLVRRKILKDPDAYPQNILPKIEGETKSELECLHKPIPSLTFPVVPEDSSLSLPVSYCPPLAIPHFEGAPESNSPAASSNPGISPSSTRRLVKKLSSKLKAKLSKSPSSSNPSSPLSSGSPTQRRASKFSFSRRDKEKEPSEDGWPDEEIFADTSTSSKRRCLLTKKCSFRKDKTPEPSLTRKSPLGRMSSSSKMDFSLGTDVTSTLHDAPPTRYNSQTVFNAGHKNFDLWLTVGLLVALLFLLVSRFSAIVATSLLFFLLSHALKESSYYRMPRRDIDTFGRQSLESLSRKPPSNDLHRKLP